MRFSGFDVCLPSSKLEPCDLFGKVVTDRVTLWADYNREGPEKVMRRTTKH